MMGCALYQQINKAAKDRHIWLARQALPLEHYDDDDDELYDYL